MRAAFARVQVPIFEVQSGTLKVQVAAWRVQSAARCVHMATLGTQTGVLKKL
jgi:hypothetical protein